MRLPQTGIAEMLHFASIAEPVQVNHRAVVLVPCRKPFACRVREDHFTTNILLVILLLLLLLLLLVILLGLPRVDK